MNSDGDYDFVKHRPHHIPTNILESTGHLIKGCLGGGILGMPEAYLKCGLWTAVIATIIFGFYITYCVNILLASAQTLYVRLKIPMMSYPDLAQKATETAPSPTLRKFAKLFRYSVDVIICIDLFGSCCVYEIIIASTLQQLITGEDTDVSVLRLYIALSIIPILLLCMIRSLKYLAPFTLVADFFIIICVITTIVYGFQNSPPLDTMPAWHSLPGFFEASGVIVFSMEGVGVSLPIENNMKEPRKYPIVLLLGMAVVGSFVMLTGFFGYWGYGEGVKSPITLNFPRTAFPTILKALIAFMIFVTFGLNFWAPFNLCWHYLKRKHPDEKHYIWERIYRAICVIVITVVAVAFPNMGNLMGVIGSFCLSNMGFMFPALIETLVMWEQPGMGVLYWRLWKNIIIFLIGVILCISGTYYNAIHLVK